MPISLGPTSTPLTRQAIACAWAAALYFILAAGTISLTSDGRTIAAIWPANAILVALLLAGPVGRPWWPTLTAGFLANVAANWVTRGTALGPLAYGVANIIEVLVAARLLSRDLSSQHILGSLRTAFNFIVSAGLLAPLAGSVIGTATAALLFGQRASTAFTTWMLSDALGLLLFIPLFYSLLNGDVVDFLRGSGGRKRWEAATLMAVVGVTTWFCFYASPQPMLFMIFPPMVVVAFRIGRLGTKVAVSVVALIAAYATMKGYGPAAAISHDPAVQAHALQLFLAVLLLTCLPIAAEVTARTRIADEVADREREMAVQLVTDPLTGINNRVGFERQVSNRLARGDHGSLVAIDIDRFKEINDFHGHQAGDRALGHLATILSRSVRATDVVGRLSGDEFALFLADHHSDDARIVCDRARSALAKSPFILDGERAVWLKISCGVSASNSESSYEALLRSADLALYRAKARGRDTVEAVAA